MIRSLTLVWLLAAGTALAQPDKPDPKPAAPTTAPAPSAPIAPAAPAKVTPLAHVEIKGAGPVPVVLIPGLMCDWTVWDEFMKRNAAAYTMYAVTLPGFGKSDPPPIDTDTKPSDGVWLANAEAAIVEMIAEKKLDKPLIIGHSMGGHLAARLAGKLGDKIRGAVTIDGFAAFPISPTELTPKDRAVLIDGEYAKQMNAVADDAWAAQVKAGLKSWVKSEERAGQLGEACAAVPRTTAIRYFLELLASDARGELTKATSPFLMVAAIPDAAVVNGPNGIIRSTWDSQSKLTTKTSLAYFEDTRHFVMDDAPTELDAAIAAFVAGKPVEGKNAPANTAPPVKAVPVDEKPADAPPKATPVEAPKK